MLLISLFNLHAAAYVDHDTYQDSDGIRYYLMYYDVNSESITYSNSWSRYSSAAAINGQSLYTSSQYSLTIRCVPRSLVIYFLQAPASGSVDIYVNGDLIDTVVVPQSDSYSLYEYSIPDFDQESDIVILNKSNSVYVSGSAYQQNGRCYFAGYSVYDVPSPSAVEELWSFIKPFLPFVIILSMFLAIVIR